MEPSALAAATEVQTEPKERKKIHFAVPSTDPTQLDPRQVEMIRRRRPTPATLFRVADQTSPEDDQSTHQWVVGENGVLKPKRVNPNVYQPPSLRAVQKMAEAQMQHLGVYPPLEDFEGEEYEDYHHWHEKEEEGEEEEEEEKPPTDQQETTNPGQSEKALRVTETAKDRQDVEKDAGEGKEAGEEQKTKEESRRGSD